MIDGALARINAPVPLQGEPRAAKKEGLLLAVDKHDA